MIILFSVFILLSFYIAIRFHKIISPDFPPENKILAYSERTNIKIGSGELITVGSDASLKSKIRIFSSSEADIIWFVVSLTIKEVTYRLC